MKLTEITNPNPNHYKLYVDLDGVLANFMKHAKKITGVDLDKADKSETTEFFKELDKRARDGKKFFEDMDLMPDAMVLWNHIKKYDPIILSSTGHTLGAAEEKRAWVKKHLGYEAAKRALFVRQSKEKAKYANSHSILIDDRSKSIDPWVKADGIGILHVSASKTIKELKKLGL
jgi:5'(3')-deoxyribonucleotidase